MSGRLFIIATPVGNLGDLTMRAGQALSEADLVLAEDTRVTIKLLNHLSLKKRMVSCHDFNESRRAGLLADFAGQGATVALVSDAGTPLVSDPGYTIVQEALALGMTVVPIPGPSAFLLALVGSGLACDRFVFEGFLPDKKGERAKRLKWLASEPRTIVFYVPPHDAERTLNEVIAVLGDRQACLARELTKKHEEFVRGTASEIAESVSRRPVLGECVLVVSGAAPVGEIKSPLETVAQALRHRLESGEHLKEASRLVAEEHGWSKSDIYKLGLELRKEGEGERASGSQKR